ncbi:MAG: hypothetical protein ALECFALPRED_000682 [Alectoria fallacina]|uniref:Malate dehydrogenase n=1 Tax=Alectoria fallacina TaxID=1903189 RepID=A0A8H3I850_9LECA|nr:MAG: hypothetical protein ALECFALPRED_000682 [Alectoria fallacina]
MVASRLPCLAPWIAVFLALASTLEARPSKRDALPTKARNWPSVGNGLSGYSVPLSDGNSAIAVFSRSTESLPAPNGTLKFITIGRGTQNYTCTSTSASPVLVGANAVLLDASPLLPLLPPGQGTAVLDILPSFVIELDFAAIEVSQIPKLGVHYFDSNGVPTFDLGNNGFLKGKGLADIPAPANASAGQFDQGYGAVDWKTLADAGGSVGLNKVYRVETAGGKAQPSCAGVTAPIYIDYSALYWFYD